MPRNYNLAVCGYTLRHTARGYGNNSIEVRECIGDKRLEQERHILDVQVDIFILRC